jgi:hypothetical protein
MDEGGTPTEISGVEMVILAVSYSTGSIIFK